LVANARLAGWIQLLSRERIASKNLLRYFQAENGRRMAAQDGLSKATEKAGFGPPVRI